MVKNKWRGFIAVIAGFTLLHTACAQVPAQVYLSEQKAIGNSTVLLNNQSGLIPFKDLENNQIVSIHFSASFYAAFDSLLNKYDKVNALDGNQYITVKNTAQLAGDVKMYNTVIVQLTDNDLNNPQIINFITSNQQLKNMVVVLFGQGQSLAKLNDVSGPLLLCPKVTPQSAQYCAQVLFGGIAVIQKLTSNYSAKFVSGAGYLTSKTRLQYSIPEDVGINAQNLTAIDDIAREAIAQHATPGCVVLVAKDGKVIFNKAYGSHTYDNQLPDKITDIFDLASVTKVSATTMEAMRLYDQGKLALDSTVGHYIALARTTNKNDIQVRELLEHQAGLIPDIPTYERLKPTDVSTDSSAAFPTKVVDHYFLRKDYYKDVMWPEMLASPLKTRGQYVYSDLSMYFVREIEETITAIPLNVYVQNNFYNPLGMQTAGFLPLHRFPVTKIIPTENDEVFRHVLLDGYVHDPGAAMLGGVSGHAGLFASANDLAILYQMILNKGTYGGVQYFKPETVDLFTAKQSAVSRRGLGFDRWDPIAEHKYPSELASPDTYGHTGYTGTCFWVDPKSNLVYIFLSNRVNPKVSEKLGNLRIRPRIQDAVYKAIAKGL